MAAPSDGSKLKDVVVLVKFVSDRDVIHHITPNKPRQVRKVKKPPIKPRLPASDDDSDTSLSESVDLCSITRSDDVVDDVTGSEVFSFVNPKNATRLSQVVIQSINQSQQLKEDNSTPPTVNTPSTVADVQLQGATPRRSTRLATGGLTPSVEPRDSLTNDDSSDSYIPSNSDNDSSNHSMEEDIPIATNKPATTSTNRKRVVITDDMPSLVDEYFSHHSGTVTVATSDNTLSRLKQPTMDRHTLSKHVTSLANHHQRHIEELLSEYRSEYMKWMYHMYNGYNLLFYGVGSKRLFLNGFIQSMMSSFSYLIVNGYFPGISLKQVINSVSGDILEYSGSFRSQQDQIQYIINTYSADNDECPGDLFLLVHNIDGGGLRGDKTQSVLSQLGSADHIHIIATIDHINAPLLWDQKKMTSFNWMWLDLTTLLPYKDETAYENTLMVRQSGALALSSLNHVINSLTPNAQGIFYILLKYQLQHQHDTSYTGMSLQLLYQRCREAFLVNTDLTLRSQLTEFKDHKLIRIKKGADGVDMLVIPVDGATLQEFIDESITT